MAMMERPRAILRKGIKKLDSWKIRLRSDNTKDTNTKLTATTPQSKLGVPVSQDTLRPDNKTDSKKRISAIGASTLHITSIIHNSSSSASSFTTTEGDPRIDAASPGLVNKTDNVDADGDVQMGGDDPSTRLGEGARPKPTVQGKQAAPSTTTTNAWQDYDYPNNTGPRKRDVAWAATREVIGLLDKAAEAFAPLKGATSVIVEIFDRYDKVQGIESQNTEFRQQMKALVTMINGLRGTTDSEMKAQLEALSRYFIEAGARLESRLSKKAMKYIAVAEDAEAITEEIRRMQSVIEVFMMYTAIQTYTSVNTMEQNYLMASLGLVRGSEFQREDRPCCTHGTRLTLLADLLTWAQTPTPTEPDDSDTSPDTQTDDSVLWIGGIVGTGKTTVAETFCRMLASKKLLAGSFFCSRKSEDRRNVRLIFPSLARCLARTYDPFRSALLTVLKGLQGDDILGMNINEQFTSLIATPLQEVVGEDGKAGEEAMETLKGMCFVVDALDECDDKDAMEQFLTVILNNASTHSVCPIKFCVTGRPEVHIREKLSSSSATETAVKLHPSIQLHEMDDEVVQNDIHLYLSTVLGGIPKLRKAYSGEGQWPPPEVRTLTERAGKLFVYASTVFKYVKDCRSDPKSRLLKILSVPPTTAIPSTSLGSTSTAPGTAGAATNEQGEGQWSAALSASLALSNLHAMYALIFKDAFGALDADEQMLSRHCLMVLSCAQEPLSVRDYSVLHGTTTDQVRVAFENLHSLVDVPEEQGSSTSTSSSLSSSEAGPSTSKADSESKTEGNAEPINVYHFSIIEYIVGPQNVIPVPWCCTMSQAHMHMVRKCIGTVLEDGLRFGVGKIATSDRALDTVPPITGGGKIPSWLVYGSFHWPKHWIGAVVGAGGEYVGMRSVAEGAVVEREKREREEDERARVAAFRQELVGLCERFLKGKFLYWLEVLATLKHLQYASSSIIQIQTLGGSKSNELKTMCRESIHFISQFKKAIEFNPAHIYISALPLTSPDSYIVKNFGSKFQGTLSATYTPNVTEEQVDMGSGGSDCSFEMDVSSDDDEETERRPTTIAILASNPPSPTTATNSSLEKKKAPFPYFSFQALPEIIHILAVSPNSKYIAAAYCNSDKLYIWALDTGSLYMGPLFGRAGTVTSLVFSADSARLVCGTEVGRILVWDVGRGVVVVQSDTRKYRFGEGGGVGFLALFTAPAKEEGEEGKSVLASGHFGGEVRFWDVETCELVTDVRYAVYHAHTAKVTSLSFSEDGMYLVSGSEDKSVHVRDLGGGDEREGMMVEGKNRSSDPLRFTHSDIITGVTFNKDSTRIFFTAEDERLHILKFPSMEIILQFEGILDSSSLESLAMSPNGELLLTGTHDGRLVLWSTEPDYLTVGLPWKAHASSINSVAFIPNTKLVVSGSQDFTIHIWDLKSIDISKLYLQDDAKDRPRKFESVAYTPNGEFIVGATDYGSVSVWDARSGVRREHDIHMCSSEKPVVAVSPDSQFVALGDECKLKILDTQTLEPHGEDAVEHADRITGVVYSPDGTTIFTSGLDARILRWSRGEDGGAKLSGTLIQHQTPIHCLALSGDGSTMAFGAENDVIIANSTSGQIIYVRTHDLPVLSIQISPTSNILLAAYGLMDFNIEPSLFCIWDYNTGEYLDSLEGHHEKCAWALAISPDGRYFATGSSDHKIFVYETDDPETQRTVLIGHTDEVTCLAFSPDGRRLVSGSYDLSARVWDLHIPEPAANAHLEDVEMDVAMGDVELDDMYLEDGAVPNTPSMEDAESDPPLDDTEPGTPLEPDPPMRYLHEDRAQVIAYDRRSSKGHRVKLPFKGFREQGYYGWSGWLQDSDGNHLIWVPPERREALKTPGTAMILGVEETLEIDFTRFVHGNDWMRCYTG